MKIENKRSRFKAFTLVEVVVALAIAALVLGGILNAYIQAGTQTEWAGYSLAAQSIGIQAIEQARSAVWDNSIGKNELTNMYLTAWSYDAGSKIGRGYSTRVLDVPTSGTNVVMATNFVTVKMLTLTGASQVQIQMISVDTVWLFRDYRGRRLMTNQIATYFGPDNRDVSSL